MDVKKERGQPSPKKYIKYGDKKSFFSILGEPFECDSCQEEIIVSTEFEEIEFSDIPTMKEVWRNSELWSSLNVYDTIYLIEKLSDVSYKKYIVEWRSR